MANNFRPERAIVPIVRATKALPVSEVLGTGFFVGDESMLHVITAKHVFTDNPLREEEKYAIAFAGSSKLTVLAILEVKGSLQYDLAACRVSPEYLGDAVSLPIAQVEPSLNADVFTFEYSATRIEREGQKTHVVFEPYMHKGNIVRAFNSSFPESHPTPSFLTSFPALQGASGAPVFAAFPRRHEFAVVGMTVANVERRLMPAQILTIDDESGHREETRYFLPFGKAIARSVLFEELRIMGVPFAVGAETDGPGAV